MMASPVNKFAGSDLALYGMFVSVMLVVGYIESFIPMPFAIPGIKIGLSNIVIIWLIYSMNIKSAIIVDVVRVILSSFLFGNLYSLLFSFAGAALSLVVMLLLKKIGRFSITGVSIAGGVSHNIGQIAVAMLVLENAMLVSYLPFLIISGVVFGIVVGIVAGILHKKIKILQTNVHL